MFLNTDSNRYGKNAIDAQSLLQAHRINRVEINMATNGGKHGRHTHATTEVASISIPAVTASATHGLQPKTVFPVSWKVGSNNTWDTASAWSNGKVPNSSNAATISVAGTYIVTIGGSDSANSLTIGDQTATALVTGNLSITTSLSVASGTLALGNDGAISGGTVSLTAGSSLLSSGVVTSISSVIAGTGAYGVGSGVLDLTGSGSLAGTLLSGAGTLVLDGGKFISAAGSLTGAGNLEVSAGTLAVNGSSGTLAAGLSVNGSGTLSVASGTNLTLSGAVTLGSPAANFSGPAFITGPGTLTTSGTTTVAGYDTVNELFVGGQVTWVNAGTVNDSGFVYLNTLSPDTVAIVNQAGATFNLIGAGATSAEYQNGTDTFTNAGTLTSSSGTAVSDIWATTTSTGAISVASGTSGFPEWPDQQRSGQPRLWHHAGTGQWRHDQRRAVG